MYQTWAQRCSNAQSSRPKREREWWGSPLLVLVAVARKAFYIQETQWLIHYNLIFATCDIFALQLHGNKPYLRYFLFCLFGKTVAIGYFVICTWRSQCICSETFALPKMDPFLWCCRPASCTFGSRFWQVVMRSSSKIRLLWKPHFGY